jgi:trimeric autotransporter adhesin
MERILLCGMMSRTQEIFMRLVWRRMSIVHAVLVVSACGVTDTDEPSPVESVVVTPPTLEIGAGATGTLDAEVSGVGGTVLRDRRVVWASSNPGVATVSDKGVVTGVSAGQVEIAATAEGKSGLASVTVIAAPAKVASVKIAPDKADLFVAAGTSLVATAYDSRGVPIPGRAVVWTTNNALVAAVSQSGRVTALIPGTAVITAVIDGVTGHATINVSLVPVASVTVVPPDVSIDAGKSTTLSARVMDAAGNTLTGRAVAWSSGDTRIATVDQAGVVRGVRRGTTVVTATSEGKLGTATIRVE